MSAMLLITIINWVFGLIALLMLVRVILQVANVPTSNPFVRLLLTVTDPVLVPIRRLLGHGNAYQYMGRVYVDIAPLVAMFAALLLNGVLVRLIWMIVSPPVWLLQPFQNFEVWLIGVIRLLFGLYEFAILLRVILAWLRVSYATKVMRVLWDLTEPLLGPIRRRVPTIAGFDFSPVVALIVLSLIQWVVIALVSWGAAAFV